jgi:ABC-type sugar transport system substrate-binding protein
MMKKTILMTLTLALAGLMVTTPAESAKKKKQKPAVSQQQLWPDGTPMDAWFQKAAKVDIQTLGRQYVITDYGVVKDSTVM